MKLYRLKDDNKWNYGIRLHRSYQRSKGYELEIFFCKFLQNTYGMSISNGFYIELWFHFGIIIERGFGFYKKTKTPATE